MSGSVRNLFTVAAWALALGWAVAPPPVVGAEQALSTTEEGVQEASVGPMPSVADLVPLATRLSARLSTLKKDLGGPLDPSLVETELQTHRETADGLRRRLDALTASRSYGHDQLSGLKAAIRAEIDGLDVLSKQLSTRLKRLEDAQQSWLEEKQKWTKWRSSFPSDLSGVAVEATFAEARRAIDSALDAVSRHLEPVLEVQRQVGDLEARLQDLEAEVNALIEGVRSRVFERSAPSMVAPQFYRQFQIDLWRELWANLRGIRGPTGSFLASQGWVAILQILAAAALWYTIRRHQALLGASDRWSFLTARPVAAALLVGFGALSPLYSGLIPIWRLLLSVVLGVAAARLVAGVIRHAWKRYLVYLMVLLFLADQAFRVFAVPLPLFRVFQVVVAGVGLPLFLWRAARSAARKDSLFYTWSLRLGGGVFAVVLVAQLGGYSALATHLLEASIQSVFLVLLAWLLALLLRGGWEYLLSRALVHRLPILRQNAESVLRRLVLFTDALVGFGALVAILQVWWIYDTSADAMHGLLSLGFTVGEQTISVGLIAAAAAVLYAAVVVSRAVQVVLTEEVYSRRQMELGARLSVNRLIHYAFVLVGFLLALSFLGLDLRNLTILAGAFGIGIGFGLQNIVNNFVSGLILLFERPVKVGDIVQLGADWGTISKLGLRATVVQTFDRSEIIVPNSDLISNQVVNWTYSDKSVRVIVPVGVAYGSDVPLVFRILEGAARDHPLVLADPAPMILFKGFGNSSLDFELRAWIEDVNNRLTLASELNREIDRRFRESRVEIPFPQRDLHLRTVDDRARGALTSVVQGSRIGPNASGSGGPVSGGGRGRPRGEEEDVE